MNVVRDISGADAAISLVDAFLAEARRTGRQRIDLATPLMPAQLSGTSTAEAQLDALGVDFDAGVTLGSMPSQAQVAALARLGVRRAFLGARLLDAETVWLLKALTEAEIAAYWTRGDGSTPPGTITHLPPPDMATGEAVARPFVLRHWCGPGFVAISDKRDTTERRIVLSGAQAVLYARLGAPVTATTLARGTEHSAETVATFVDKLAQLGLVFTDEEGLCVAVSVRRKPVQAG